MESVAVGFSDGEFGGAEVELIAFDLADGAEVDDVGTMDSDEMRREQFDELLQSDEAHDGFIGFEDEGGVVSLGLDVLQSGKVDAVDGVTVFEKEGIGGGFRRSGSAVFEFQDGFCETTEVEGLDQVVDDVELVALSSEVGVGADDDYGSLAWEGLEKGDAVNPRELQVEEDGVEGLGGEKMEGGGTVVDFKAVVDGSDLGEVALDQIAGQGVVIDYEAFHGAS